MNNDADIVIYNPKSKYIFNKEEMSFSKSDYSIWEGYEYSGKIETVILRGEFLLKNNTPVAKIGFGKYIKRD